MRITLISALALSSTLMAVAKFTPLGPDDPGCQPEKNPHGLQLGCQCGLGFLGCRGQKDDAPPKEQKGLVCAVEKGYAPTGTTDMTNYVSRCRTVDDCCTLMAGPKNSFYRLYDCYDWKIPKPNTMCPKDGKKIVDPSNLSEAALVMGS